MKSSKFNPLCFLGILAVLSLFPFIAVADDDPAPAVEKEAPAVPKTELDKLKKEWEAVREQQIQMIREKEDQLEKLKEEIFAKMKASSAPAAPVQPPVEAERTALQAERQKFFSEMNRQKENLRQLQAALDEKTKQLAAERERFEQEKKTAAR